MKLDLMNRKILYELDINSRSKLSEIAKNVRSTKQVVKYRINRLLETGIIKQFTTIVDVSKLGFLTYRVYGRYQNVTPQMEKEIEKYFIANSNVLWFVGTRGMYDFEAVFVARNFVHFNKILSDILLKYGQKIRDYSLSMSTDNFHFRRCYLIPEKKVNMIAHYGGEPNVSIDNLEFKILKALSTNSRISSYQISKSIGLSANTVRSKIKKLEKSGIIQGYRVMLDTGKIGYKWYKILLSFNNNDEASIKKMISFCSRIPNMHYFVKCLGKWEAEIELHVLDENEFRSILMEIRDMFPQMIRDYEMLTIHEENKLDYVPMKGFNDVFH